MLSLRRTLIFLGLIICILVTGCQSNLIVPPTPTSSHTSSPENTPAYSQFVTAASGKFYLEGKSYYYIGANFWQGMNLGVDGPSGNRALLEQDLDQLQQLGVTNLRVMASSEGPNTEPYRMVPALMDAPGVYNQSVLDGLDYLLFQMGKRGMKAVMVLNNYWQWSGGMGQYVSWSEQTPIPYPGDYGTFMSYVANFYACAECQTWYRDHIQAMIDHTNPYTGLKYRDDPTVFSWELANEPRRYPISWINDTAAFIKSLDPNHMVTTGSEGTPRARARTSFSPTRVPISTMPPSTSGRRTGAGTIRPSLRRSIMRRTRPPITSRPTLWKPPRWVSRSSWRNLASRVTGSRSRIFTVRTHPPPTGIVFIPPCSSRCSRQFPWENLFPDPISGPGQARPGQAIRGSATRRTRRPAGILFIIRTAPPWRSLLNMRRNWRN